MHAQARDECQDEARGKFRRLLDPSPHRHPASGHAKYSREEIPDVAHWWPLAYPDPEYRREVEGEWQRRILKAMARGAQARLFMV